MNCYTYSTILNSLFPYLICMWNNVSISTGHEAEAGFRFLKFGSLRFCPLVAIGLHRVPFRHTAGCGGEKNTVPVACHRRGFLNNKTSFAFYEPLKIGIRKNGHLCSAITMRFILTFLFFLTTALSLQPQTPSIANSTTSTPYKNMVLSLHHALVHI